MSKTLQPPCLCPCSLGTKTGVNMRERLAATHPTDQARDECILGCRAYLLLIEIKLLIQGVKELAWLQTITEQGSWCPLGVGLHVGKSNESMHRGILQLKLDTTF